MGIFGALLKTAIDVATTPIDIVSDVVTMGGAMNDEESAVVKKARRLANDLEDIRDEVDYL